MLNTLAPDFELEASTGHKVTLADLRGAYVVLIFYPANDTPTCNSQLDEMSISAEKLYEYNARVFGVNTASAVKAKEFCTRRRLEFPSSVIQVDRWHENTALACHGWHSTNGPSWSSIPVEKSFSTNAAHLHPTNFWKR